jgi:fucose permease
MPLALLAFFAFGILLVLPGALQPAWALAYELDMHRSGLLGSALAGGLGLGVLASGPVADRFSRRPVFVAATAAVAAALAALAAVPDYTALLAVLAAIGLAAGCYETLLNSAVPELDPARGAPRLAAIHAAATLGAVAGAQLLGRGSGLLGAPGVCLALALAFGGVLAAGAFTQFPPPPRRAATRSPRPLPRRALAPLALASLAYVGLETAFSVLLPAYASATGDSASAGQLAISAFWGGLFGARVVYARSGSAASARTVRWAGAAGALLLAAGAALSAAPLALFSAAVGLALGVVFPLLVALAGDAEPLRRATALGLVVAAGSLGGVALPWLAGAAGDWLGARAALGTLALAAGAIALGAWRAERVPTSGEISPIDLKLAP